MQDKIPHPIQPFFRKYYQDNPLWLDRTIYFKNIIQEYLKEDFVILNAGAGASPKFDYKNSVRRIIGIDIDRAVLSNPTLNEAYVCDIERMPFEDGKFDLVILDCVLEHLKNPCQALAEIKRVIRPAGVVILRTPNIYHYVYAGGFFIPKLFYSKLLKREPLIRYYRCNTKAKLKKMFVSAGFKIERLEMIEGEPTYLMFFLPLFLLGVFYERLVNKFSCLGCFRSNIIAVCRPKT